MRFVAVKSAAQQTTLMLHRVRDLLLRQRTALINALRGHLAEFGVVAAQRRAGLRQLLALIADLEDDRVPPLARQLLQLLLAQLRELEAKLAELDRQLLAKARSDPIARSLCEVPGVGPIVATALTATLPAAGSFRSGRHLAACGWLPGATTEVAPERRAASCPPSTAPAASRASSASANAATVTCGAS